MIMESTEPVKWLCLGAVIFLLGAAYGAYKMWRWRR